MRLFGEPQLLHVVRLSTVALIDVEGKSRYDASIEDASTACSLAIEDGGGSRHDASIENVSVGCDLGNGEKVRHDASSMDASTGCVLPNEDGGGPTYDASTAWDLKKRDEEKLRHDASIEDASTACVEPDEDGRKTRRDASIEDASTVSMLAIEGAGGGSLHISNNGAVFDAKSCWMRGPFAVE